MSEQQELAEAVQDGQGTAEAEGKVEGEGEKQQERMVRVTEAIRYRRRAQAAEKQLEELAASCEGRRRS